MKETDEKLALFVNGRLGESERVELERQLVDDPELAREVQFLHALRDGIREQDQPVPGELGLARLKRDIARETQPSPNRASGQKGYWKPVALAACVLLGVQTVILIGPQGWRNAADTDIRPAAGERRAQGPQLQIVFDQGATAGQIQVALLSVSGTIVDGPGALGIYRLELPPGAEAVGAVEQLSEFAFVEEVIAL